MFEYWRFRKLFGFAPPEKYDVDFAAAKIVAIRLAALEAKADERKAIAENIEEELRSLSDSKEIIAKRSAWMAAKRAYRAEETALAAACHFAVECGFRPVERYQIIWDRAQEREAKARRARLEKRHA